MSLKIEDLEAQLNNAIAQRDMMLRNYYQLAGAVDILSSQLERIKNEKDCRAVKDDFPPVENKKPRKKRKKKQQL